MPQTWLPVGHPHLPKKRHSSSGGVVRRDELCFEILARLMCRIRCRLKRLPPSLRQEHQNRSDRIRSGSLAMLRRCISIALWPTHASDRPRDRLSLPFVARSYDAPGFTTRSATCLMCRYVRSTLANSERISDLASIQVSPHGCGFLRGYSCPGSCVRIAEGFQRNALVPHFR